MTIYSTSKKPMMIKLDANKIFNLDNAVDLPEEMQIILQKAQKKLSEVPQKILDMFNILPRLSVAQVWVGLYRLHGITRPKGYVNVTLHNLAVSGKHGIEKVEGLKQIYEKVS